MAAPKNARPTAVPASCRLEVKVIPGAVQRDANLWQRPIILADAAVCFLMTFFI